MKNLSKSENIDTSDASQPEATDEVEPHFALVFLFRATAFGLCSYGLLYYAYKYYQPHFGGEDYFRYSKMYLSPFDHPVPDPYRTRRLSALLTHLILRGGVYYPNSIAFEQSLAGQRVFFAALCANALSLWATALVCAYTTRARGAVPMLAGLLVLLSFGSQLFVLTGLTEGPSWFLVALGFYFYSRQKLPALCVVLLLGALQRETISIVFACFAVADWAAGGFGRANSRARANGITLAVAMASFAMYLWLRTLDPAPGRGTGQLDLGRMWNSLRGFRPGAAWVFQVILSQNLLFLWALTAFLSRKVRPKNLNPVPDNFASGYAPHLMLAVAALTLGGIGAGIGNNVGRILVVLTPILAPLIAPAIARLRL